MLKYAKNKWDVSTGVGSPNILTYCLENKMATTADDVFGIFFIE